MCHGGTCCLCMPAQRACLILAIVKAVITGSMLVASVVLACLCAGFQIVGPMGFISVTAFSFTVVLCNGLCTRQPGQVKAYFVYGVVSVALEALASLLGFLAGPYADKYIVIFGLTLCALHALFVVLVHHTYIQMTEAKSNPLVMI